jgi:hypothetical protein
MANEEATALLLAALACGERLGAKRAQDNARFAPDERARQEQQGVAAREERNVELVTARLSEVGSLDLPSRFLPFFEAFHQHTEPTDWVEAQTFHYVGDALVSEFGEELATRVDPISAEVVRKTMGEREDLETFALDELTRAMETEPDAKSRIAAYARRISGEAFTQTKRALESTTVLRDLLGGESGEKRMLLQLLESHRQRLDRLGIDLMDIDDDEDDEDFDE